MSEISSDEAMPALDVLSLSTMGKAEKSYTPGVLGSTEALYASSGRTGTVTGSQRTANRHV